MNKLLTGLLILGYAFLLVSCEKSEPAGPLTTISKDLHDFNELDLDGSMHLIIDPKQTDDIRITAPDNLQRHIESYVFSNRLIIREDHNHVESNNVVITISETALSFIRLSGSGRITGDTVYNVEISIKLNGSGEIDLPVSCEELKTQLDGSGRISAIGNATEVISSLSGSGSIVTRNIASDNASAHVHGSGSIDIFAYESLFARVDGSGSIRYWGEPSSVDSDVDGSGSIISKD